MSVLSNTLENYSRVLRAKLCIFGNKLENYSVLRAKVCIFGDKLENCSVLSGNPKIQV